MQLRQPTRDEEDQWTPEEDQFNTEDEIQTLYVYYDDPDKPHWNKEKITAASMGVLTLALILAFCFIPTGLKYQIQTITVPASFHTWQFTAESAILPTGKEQHPATTARGILTIYNGSVFTQQLPAHFVVSTQSSVEVETDTAVTIEAANPPMFGKATVSAHAIEAGSQGNITVLAIDQTYNGSLFLKNLTAFSGGQNATTTTYVTSQDKTTALQTARAQLAADKPLMLQSGPCTENTSQHDLKLSVRWSCQFVTYQPPQGAEVLSASLKGTTVLLKIRTIIHPVVTHFAK